MTDKKPELTIEEGTAQMEDESDSPHALVSKCGGHILLEGNTLTVKMAWHLSHAIDETTRKEFFKYRCHALADAFGDLKGVTGIRMDENHHWQPDNKIGRPRVGKCGVSMGYKWPNLKDPNWEILKARFVDVFAPAAIYGELAYHENKQDLSLTGVFALPEKGQSDA